MANWVADFLAAHPGGEIVRRDRHALHVQGPGREHIAYITGAPMHYLDAGKWLPLDTTLKELSPGVYGAPGLDVRLTTDGAVQIAGTNHTQSTQRIGVFNPTTGAFTPVWTLPQGKVDGDRIVREGKGWEHELRLTETGLRETLTLLEPPPISGKADEWLMMETAVGGLAAADGEIGEFTKVGYRFPSPHTVDVEGNIAPCKRFWRDGKLYSGIPVSWLATAVYPVMFDPNFTGDAADGYVQGYSVTYATARSTSTYYTAAGTTFNVGQWTNFLVNRGFLKFDTSTIGAGSTVTQVNLQLVCTGDNSVADFDLQIVKYSWAGEDALSDGNREAAFDGCLAATLDDHIWRNTSGMSANIPYTSDVLATDWVQIETPTYYGLRSSEDSANSQPSQGENLYLASASHATAAYRPVLIVAYDAGGAAAQSLGPHRAYYARRRAA
jgi:hypothetical protein